MGDPSRLSDEALLIHLRKHAAEDRARQANDAFGRLFYRYERVLLARALAKLPVDDAQDAVQLIGLKFWAQAQSDVEIENVKAYIHGIARNVIADQAEAVKRQRQRRAPLPSEHLDENDGFVDDLGESDAAFESLENRLATGPIIAAVCAGLNPLHRRIIDLCELGDHTPAETVDLIGAEGGEMTRDNVYQIRRRFHVELKKALVAAGITGEVG